MLWMRWVFRWTSRFRRSLSIPGSQIFKSLVLGSQVSVLGSLWLSWLSIIQSKGCSSFPHSWLHPAMLGSQSPYQIRRSQKQICGKAASRPCRLGGTPTAGCSFFSMENPMKTDDLEASLFQETSIWGNSLGWIWSKCGLVFLGESIGNHGFDWVWLAIVGCSSSKDPIPAWFSWPETPEALIFEVLWIEYWWLWKTLQWLFISNLTASTLFCGFILTLWNEIMGSEMGCTCSLSVVAHDFSFPEPINQRIIETEEPMS